MQRQDPKSLIDNFHGKILKTTQNYLDHKPASLSLDDSKTAEFENKSLEELQASLEKIKNLEERQRKFVLANGFKKSIKDAYEKLNSDLKEQEADRNKIYGRYLATIAQALALANTYLNKSDYFSTGKYQLKHAFADFFKISQSVSKDEKNPSGRKYTNEIIIEITQIVSNSISNYLDENKEKGSNFNLIATFKHWANPLGNFKKEDGLSEKDKQKYFKRIQAIIDDPRQLLPSKNLTEEDIAFIRKFLRITLDQTAHDLDPNKIIPEENAEGWWNKKTDEEKQQIRNKANEEKEYYTIFRKNNSSCSPSSSGDNFLFYYWLCNHNSFCDFYLLDMTVRATVDVAQTLMPLAETGVRAGIHLGKLAVEGIGHTVSGIGGGRGCGGDGSIDCGGDGCFYLIAGAALAAAAVAFTYGIKKAFNSLYNIAHGDKVLRSLFRLGCIGAGGYISCVKGMLIGAAIGSAVPIVGTAVGAILGGIIGLGIGTGLSALAAKYIAKGISKIVYWNALNPTNPEKWELTESQKNNLRDKGISVLTTKNMITALKKQKGELGLCGSIPMTDERKKKNHLNKLLKQIKNGDINIDPMTPLNLGGTLFYPRKNIPIIPTAASTHQWYGYI